MSRINRPPTGGDSAVSSPARGVADRTTPATLPSFSAHLPADLVERSALWRRLDAVGTYPVLLVTAPGGYGKTIAVASWLEHRQRTDGEMPAVAWHSGTALDNTLLVFCSTLVSKLCEAVHCSTMCPVDGCFVRTRQLLGVQGVLVPGHLAAVFCEDAAALSICMELVLDDYHEIHDSAVNEFVQSALRRIPANLRWRILTRKKLAFSVARLRSQNKLASITIHDLQLNVDESNTLLRNMLGDSLLPETLTTIHQQTEGWAAGIRLIGLALCERLDERVLYNLLQRGQSIRYISDYLMDEVLSQQPEEVQSFLLQTSLLMELDVAACAAVIDDEEGSKSRTLLDHVVNSGLFVIASIPSDLSTTDVSYRYHTTFRSMLQARLHSSFRPTQVTALYRRIAAHMVKVGNIDFAIQSWLLADAPEVAAACLEARTMALMDHEDWPLLERYLSYLSESMIENRPLLLLAKIWVCNLLGDFACMRRLLDQSATLLDTYPARMDTLQLSQLQAALALARVNYQQFSGPLPTLAEAAPLESATTTFLANSYMGTLARAALSWVYSMNGEHEKSRRVITNALESIGVKPNLPTLRLMHGFLISTFSTGRLREFIANTSMYHELATQAGDPIQLIWADALCCYAAYLQNDDDRAAAHARTVLEMAHIAPLAPLMIAMVQVVRSVREQGEAQSVHRQIKMVRKQAELRKSAGMLAACNAIEAGLWVRIGHVEQALRWARSLLKPDGTLMAPLPVAQIYWLRCMAQSHDPADLVQAQQFAETLLLQYQGANYPLQRIEVGLALIRLYQLQNNQAAALDLLAALLQSATTIGFMRPLMDDATLWPLLHSLAKQPQLAAVVSPFLNESTATSATALHPTCDSAAHAISTLLTARERDTLELLVKGMTNHDIAQSLCISPNTVRNHVVNILNKLGVDSRHAAVAAAFQLGLVRAGSTSVDRQDRRI